MQVTGRTPNSPNSDGAAGGYGHQWWHPELFLKRRSEPPLADQLRFLSLCSWEMLSCNSRIYVRPLTGGSVVQEDFGANLRGADLVDAYLFSTNLTETNLSQAKIFGTTFGKASPL
jgi:hypothetical protein